jgi:hypothetical protein
MPRVLTPIRLFQMETDPVADPNENRRDPTFQQQVQRLHQLTVTGRWLVVAGLWLTIGATSLWGLRYPISLVLENFTWAAVRYGLMFDLYPAFGLFLCIGMTLGIVVWQMRNWIFGLPKHDRDRLEHYVRRINQQGCSHPLWNWINRDAPKPKAKG